MLSHCFQLIIYTFYFVCTSLDIKKQRGFATISYISSVGHVV